jgi:acyl carrier protein
VKGTLIVLRQTWQALEFGQCAGRSAAERPAVADQTQTAQAVEDWLIAYLDAKLGIDTPAIDPTAPFSCYGLRSIQSMCLVVDLSDWLGCALQPTIISEYGTIRSLATYAAYLMQPTRIG